MECFNCDDEMEMVVEWKYINEWKCPNCAATFIKYTNTGSNEYYGKIEKKKEDINSIIGNKFKNNLEI